VALLGYYRNIQIIVLRQSNKFRLSNAKCLYCILWND